MLEIPLQPVAAQTTKVVLGGQNCQIAVYQKDQGLFVDLNSNDADIVLAVIARDGVPLVCRTYVGFIGNLLFADTQGSSDPTFDGLGSRFSLVYLTDEEYALIL